MPACQNHTGYGGRSGLPRRVRVAAFRGRRQLAYCRDAALGCVFDRPLFVVGCGRSGTTLMGRILASHPEICYLHEPRRLWLRAFPETYVWNFNGFPEPNGRVMLDEQDARAWPARRLRALFHNELRFDGKQRLVEKTPLNALRMRFIDAIFPNARFIHVVRNPVAVAQSIEARCRDGDWFVRSPYYWSVIAAAAEKHPACRGLAERCATDFERGLLQWRVHVETVRREAGRFTSERLIEISYDTLVRQPEPTVEQVFGFAGLAMQPGVRAFCRSGVRAAREPNARKLTARERQIAGALVEEFGST